MDTKTPPAHGTETAAKQNRTPGQKAILREFFANAVILAGLKLQFVETRSVVELDDRRESRLANLQRMSA